MLSLPAVHRPSQAMKKIRCPHCAVVNLEKFVTFPHCAGCGTLLSPDIAIESTTAWQRPLKTLLWVTVVGLVAVGIIGAASVSEVGTPPVGQLMIYGQSTRRVRLNQTITLRLALDTLEGPSALNGKMLSGVRVRLPRRIFKSFRFVSVEPAPDEIVTIGNGRYFDYTSLARETPVIFTLRALRSGPHSVLATVSAQQEGQTTYSSVVIVGRS